MGLQVQIADQIPPFVMGGEFKIKLYQFQNFKSEHIVISTARLISKCFSTDMGYFLIQFKNSFFCIHGQYGHDEV